MDVGSNPAGVRKSTVAQWQGNKFLLRLVAARPSSEEI